MGIVPLRGWGYSTRGWRGTPLSYYGPGVYRVLFPIPSVPPLHPPQYGVRVPPGIHASLVGVRCPGEGGVPGGAQGPWGVYGPLGGGWCSREATAIGCITVSRGPGPPPYPSLPSRARTAPTGGHALVQGIPEGELPPEGGWGARGSTGAQEGGGHGYGHEVTIIPLAPCLPVPPRLLSLHPQVHSGVSILWGVGSPWGGGEGIWQGSGAVPVCRGYQCLVL